MARGTSLTTIGEAEYEAIEAAVMETARGRWFLAEFPRRNRTADTQVLLDAIGRLEQAVVAERSAQDLDRLRFDLMEMAKAIAMTKTEIAAIRPHDHPHSHLGWRPRRWTRSAAPPSARRRTSSARRSTSRRR